MQLIEFVEPGLNAGVRKVFFGSDLIRNVVSILFGDTLKG